jgi:hypothetical protein
MTAQPAPHRRRSPVSRHSLPPHPLVDVQALTGGGGGGGNHGQWVYTYLAMVHMNVSNEGSVFNQSEI